ncbi:MAG: hypothetical protein ACE15C_17660 [Phycisphaerae bacterium]
MDWHELWLAGRNAEAKPILESKAVRESPPGQATLFLGAVRSLLEADRRHIDAAVIATQSTVRPDLVMAVSGCVLWDIGLKDEGADRMRRAIAISTTADNLDTAATRFQKENAYAKEAILLFEELLKLNPDDPDKIVGRGCARERYALLLLGLAKADFESAVAADPKSATAHYELGNILALLDEFEKGLPEFRRAVELGNWRPECAHAGVAYCLQRLGRLEEAKEAVAECLRIKPDYEYALGLERQIGAALTGGSH